MTKPTIRPQDSIAAGLINGIINGGIAYHHFSGLDRVPLSVDSIASGQLSVWGQAVSLTFGLGIILSLITASLFVKQLHKTFPARQEDIRPAFWTRLLPIAIAQSAALFGWFVALAVMWTKYMGEIMVSTTVASVLVGAFAFVITLIIEYRTKHSVIVKTVTLFD